MVVFERLLDDRPDAFEEMIFKSGFDAGGFIGVGDDGLAVVVRDVLFDGDGESRRFKARSMRFLYCPS